MKLCGFVYEDLGVFETLQWDPCLAWYVLSAMLRNVHALAHLIGFLLSVQASNPYQLSLLRAYEHLSKIIATPWALAAHAATNAISPSSASSL